MPHINDSCENDDCREPHNQRFYVIDTNTSRSFCAFCWLLIRGLDESDALDLVFEGIQPNL